MKSTHLICLILALFLIVFTASFNLAQHQHGADQEKSMANWMKYATPGQAHQFLAKQEGEWEMASKVWMQPGAPPAESTGKAHGKMILGGRYLQLHHHGTMMGLPFEGVAIVAYDNHLKKFISIWIDNMGTGVSQSTGTLDDTGKVLTEQGEMYDAMSGHNLKMKTVTTQFSNDKFTMVMYHAMADGKEFKSMEMVYTRKK
ncbi:MAG: DUF1579 domain-containing protein [Candidatus Aminicenantes bacterium]|nr:DUF1579 domain-containing protein [Candidatus Aminicenantes bacterium]NIQ71691.1 DUF1579 domain-containing protein [Candidatus Aminicenantes bacterium]NIT27725.1 DUF1579 domain-containing protein [Candidatus Aminicenantes bacterium]